MIQQQAVVDASTLRGSLSFAFLVDTLWSCRDFPMLQESHHRVPYQLLVSYEPE